MHTAAILGHGEICKVLKALGASVDEKDKVCKMNIDNSNYLYDFFIFKYGKTAMHAAARSGLGEICKVLKALGASVDEKDNVWNICKVAI